jgi:hypothetical protein
MTILNGKTLFLAGALAALAACASGNDAPATQETTAPATAAGADDAQTTCVATFVRQRECTDQFIPALVDMRVRLDQPAGIAARAREAGGRDAIIAEAKTEWAEDSKDEKIAAQCEQIVGGVPAEHMQQALPEIQGCLEKSDCDAFVGCILPAIEKLHGAK